MIVGTVGSVCLRVLVGVCAGALVCHGAWGIRRSRRTEQMSRWAMLVLFVIALAAAGSLWALLIREDWSYAYVAEYTAQGLPLLYRIAALWAGNAGSLLFWCLMLTLYGVITAWASCGDEQDVLQPWVRLVLTVITGFYALVLNVAANPFTRLPSPAVAGNGLNPLLQNPGMTIHPINLYLGDVGLTVPFAYAVAALVHGRLNREWVIRSRRWTLASWLFLSIGIVYGMRWSYEELGWGGYWAWDPVENASLLPWLGATAFLHSAAAQERRGTMRRWNLVLITVTFLFTLLGTYLTRSGVVWSIHAFASGPLGTWFLTLFLTSATVMTVLLAWRWPHLRSQPPSRRRVSRRDTVFTLNNLLLLAAAVAVLWGTLLPVLSVWTVGQARVVSTQFYNDVCLTIGVLVVWLMGVGMTWTWRRGGGRQLWRQALPTVVGAVVGTGVALWLHQALGTGSWLGDLGMAAAISAIVSAVQEGVDGWQSRSPSGRRSHVWRTLWARRRRVGAWLAHLAVAVIALGIAGSGAFHVDRQVVLSPGATVQVGAYGVRYTGLGVSPAAGGRLLYANLVVEQNGQVEGAIRPAVMFYDNGEAPMTQVALYETAVSDLYAVLVGTGQGGAAVVDLHLNPLTVWIWRGGELLIVAVLLSLWPDRRRLVSSEAARQLSVSERRALERGAEP